MYKPKFNARKPNHKAIYDVVETGEFDRPERRLPQKIIVKPELGPESLKTKLQWMRYINNLEKGEGIEFCLICDRRLVHEDDVTDTIHGVRSFRKQKLKNQSIGFSSYDIKLMLNIHRHFPQSFIGQLKASGNLNFDRSQYMRFSKETSLKDLHPEFKNRKIHRYCDVYYLGAKYTFENIEKWRKYFGGNNIRDVANDMFWKQTKEL